MIEECVAYFKAKPEFDRVFKLMKKQWEKYGRAAGYIILKDPTAKEKEVLGKFLHQDYGYPADLAKIRFKMVSFQEALEITRFKNLDIKDILDAYFRMEISTTGHKRMVAQKKQADLFEALSKRVSHPLVADWFDWLRQSRTSGYMLFKSWVKDDEDSACQAIQAIDSAVGCLDRSAFPLAVLGAQVTGNPHYFDRNTKPGRLLISCLGHIHGVTTPSHAQGILELYVLAKITPDDISSSVVIKNIDLFQGDKIHQGVAGFNELNEPCVVTLGNLANVSHASSKPCVFVFENQMVFSYLASERLDNCSLVCTSGQLKVAALKLFEMLDRKVRIFYSGDFDPEGLQIADKLLGRFPNVTPWGFSEELYFKALSSEPISDVRLSKLDSLADSRLKELGKSIKDHKLAGYQENILDFYREDIVKKIKENKQ